MRRLIMRATCFVDYVQSSVAWVPAGVEVELAFFWWGGGMEMGRMEIVELGLRVHMMDRSTGDGGVVLSVG